MNGAFKSDTMLVKVRPLCGLELNPERTAHGGRAMRAHSSCNPCRRSMSGRNVSAELFRNVLRRIRVVAARNAHELKSAGWSSVGSYGAYVQENDDVEMRVRVIKLNELQVRITAHRPVACST